ncbi:MAG: hypothetical protein NT123_21695 [Proteobacteria bacterium]|nr:hypothetical protein [Pseudomonadota bacterium]
MTDEELQINGPGGTGFKFKGERTLDVILVLLLSAFFGFLVRDSDSKAESRDLKTHQALERLHEAVHKSEEAQKTMIYVLALPADEREKLNLLKPKQLEEMSR